MREIDDAVSFKGAHFPPEVFLPCVRWYIAYPLSYGHVEELMEEHGANVNHSTVNRWAIKYNLDKSGAHAAAIVSDNAEHHTTMTIRKCNYLTMSWNRIIAIHEREQSIGNHGKRMHTGYKSYGARHVTEYAPWANANIIVCVSIESLEGLDNVEAVAAVEGIDMIAYGHSDLSAQLGVHLQLEHPTFEAAVGRIVEACNTYGKLARGSAETEAQIEAYWRLGCRVLNLPGNDVSTYLDGLKARANRAHARLKSIGVPIPCEGARKELLI